MDKTLKGQVLSDFKGISFASVVFFNCLFVLRDNRGNTAPACSTLFSVRAAGSHCFELC